MSENEQATPPETPQQPQVVRDSSRLVVNVDKIDEISAYLMRARSSESYNPSVPFTVVPNSMVALDVEKFMPHPSRIRRERVFIDTKSFNAYLNEFKPGHKPKVFAQNNSDGLKVHAIIDYDEAGTEPADDKPGVLPLPRWGSHTCGLVMKFHEDYAALREHSGVWFSQKDFSLFVEEYNHLFVSPDGADMMELSQELRATRNANFIQGKRLNNGQVSLQYKEDVTATTAQGMDIPEYLTLRTPLYEGLYPQEIKAAFSYDIDEERKLKLQFRLMTKLQEREAQDNVKFSIEHETGLKILNIV